MPEGIINYEPSRFDQGSFAGWVWALIILAVATGLFLTGRKFFYRIRAVRRRKKFKDLDPAQVGKKWEEIIERTKKGTEDEYSLALIEADAFFDEILIKRYTSEMPYAKRLGLLVSQCRDIEPVIHAHRIRNRVAHDSSEKVNLYKLKKALHCYEDALKKLGLI